MFVSYCFFVSGLPLPAECPKGFKFNPNGVKWFRSNDSFFSTPEVGDVIFIDYHKGRPPCRTPDEDDCSDAWHVGIVESIDDDETVTTIEGNESNQVVRRQRSEGEWYGFGRPAYNGIPHPSPEPGYPRYPGAFINLADPPLQSDSILNWKQQMAKRGFQFSGDMRTFDRDTRDILYAFQQEKHLVVDGVLGPISWRAAWELPITA
jgi:hypothetical protein